jgi:hypothetical protein
MLKFAHTMKNLFLGLVLTFGFLSTSNAALAAEYYPSAKEAGMFDTIVCSGVKELVTITSCDDPCAAQLCSTQMNGTQYMAGKVAVDPLTGQVDSPGLLGTQARFVAQLFEYQPSSEEYVADIMNNIGLPTVSSAYAQGTGYGAMSSFLPFWKVFRNLAYSLYIIMFVVVGIMIMLRTKINAQTIITIQTALPNLLITLLLITFSYAIVGFMIDIMYFLIYFAVYLGKASGIIDDPTKLITRFMSYSAWSVIFEGRNSIISAVGSSITGIMTGLGTGAIEVAGKLLSMFSIMYLIVAVTFAIAMLKLMFALIKAYVMIIVQTVTAPLQILMNAMPGSKAFSEWLKKTASYLIPFPVAAAMFLFAAILVGNPTDKTILDGFGGDANPFGVDQSHEVYQNRANIWLPPFTLTGGVDENLPQDVLTLIGFFVFLMTPAAVKMAQDWLQVKESPYTAEAFSSIAMGAKGGALPATWGWKSFQEELAAKRSAKALGGVIAQQDKLADPRPKGSN